MSECTFDLRNAHFLEYCEAKCVVGRVGRELSAINVEQSKVEFFVRWRLAIPQADGERYRFTDDEMEIHWGIHCRGLDLLQTTWEQFNANVRYNF